jgi:hypothetical protein
MVLRGSRALITIHGRNGHMSLPPDLRNLDLKAGRRKFWRDKASGEDGDTQGLFDCIES